MPSPMLHDAVDHRGRIHLRSDRLEVELDPGAGGEFVRLRAWGHDLLAAYEWTSPVRASQSTTYGDNRLDWLSAYRGGWQLLVPNAGDACEVDGVPLPFHGEWSRTCVTVTDGGARYAVMTAGTRLPLVVERRVDIASDPDRILARTTVTNDGTQAVSFIWGEHPAFAVETGDEIDLPRAAVRDRTGGHLGTWPDAAGDLSRVDTGEPTESVHFLTDLSDGWAALRRRQVGIALAWSIEDFPHAWLWREFASPTFPFFGRSAIVAIEPASSAPGTGLAAAITRGQDFRLEPGAQRSTTVALIPFVPTGRAVVGARISGHVEFAP